jgi:hypothetical protein
MLRFLSDNKNTFFLFKNLNLIINEIRLIEKMYINPTRQVFFRLVNLLFIIDLLVLNVTFSLTLSLTTIKIQPFRWQKTGQTSLYYIILDLFINLNTSITNNIGIAKIKM